MFGSKMVPLNLPWSLCAFEQNLDMKCYTLEGAEDAEKADKSINNKFTDSKSENVAILNTILHMRKNYCNAWEGYNTKLS